MIRIDIVDDNLNQRTGHYFDFCFAIAREFKQAGFDVRVWVAQTASNDIAQHFEKLGVLFCRLPSLPPLTSQRNIDDYAHCMATALEKTEISQLVFFPTLRAENLLAVSMLGTVPRIVGLVHSEPFFDHPSTASIWRRATTTLRARDRERSITIGTIDPLIGGFLQSYLGSWSLVDMPVPIGSRSKFAYPAKPQTIGFFGYQREERGGHLIPEISQLLLQADYQVLIHDTLGRFKIDGILPGVRLVNGFTDDLAGLMKDCDVVVCTMDRGRYLHRISGIACNAIASGIPLVLPAGTLSALRFHEFGSSICYDNSTAKEIVQAVEGIAGDYPRYAEHAHRAAQQWGKKHGVRNLFDFLLEKILKPAGQQSESIPKL